MGRIKPKKTNDEGIRATTSAFTHMANSVASAISGPDRTAATHVSTPTKAVTSSSLPQGMSPGRRIELQEKNYSIRLTCFVGCIKMV